MTSKATNISHVDAILSSETHHHQSFNGVKAPHRPIVLLAGEGRLPLSGKTVWPLSVYNLSINKPNHWNTWRTSRLWKYSGNRNRPEVVFSRLKKNKRWITKALDRNTGRTMAWVVAGGSAAAVRRLYSKLEQLSECLFYTDDWDAWANVLPAERYVIGKKHTTSTEQDNPRRWSADPSAYGMLWLLRRTCWSIRTNSYLSRSEHSHKFEGVCL